MKREKSFIPIEKITPASFAQFGSVIDRKLVFGNWTQSQKLPPKASWANQGSAVKFGDASYLTNFYSYSPAINTERREARPVLTLFVCSPRKLLQLPTDEGRAETEVVHVSYTYALNAAAATARAGQKGLQSRSRRCYVDLDVLERHPYTSQTFIPMGLQPRNGTAVYLVVVAPTLPDSSYHRTSHNSPDGLIKANMDPEQNLREPDTSPPGPPAPDSPHYQRKSPGRPDLEHIRAFIVDGDTAVTYAAGTWHAPMIVLGGTESVDFVVAQFANGIADDDCQEVDVKKDRIAVEVAVPMPAEGAQSSECMSVREKAKL